MVARSCQKEVGYDIWDMRVVFFLRKILLVVLLPVPLLFPVYYIQTGGLGLKLLVEIVLDVKLILLIKLLLKIYLFVFW